MNFLRAIINLSCLIFLATGCTPAKIEPPKTQLEIREIQTRSYSSKDLKLVMKAVINALQDDGFIIKAADKELGFIAASKEADVQNSTEVFWSQFLQGAQARYRKNSVVDASANISEFGRETKVRIVFQVKVIDNFGAPLDARQIEEPNMYQDFFSRVDKSVFIERERL